MCFYKVKKNKTVFLVKTIENNTANHEAPGLVKYKARLSKHSSFNYSNSLDFNKTTDQNFLSMCYQKNLKNQQ